MSIKLFDSELHVMNALWRHGDLPAGRLAQILNEETGWNRNTTYTVIKKCIEKGAIERLEPNFVCHALVSMKEAQAQETRELIDKMFGGSEELFFTAFLSTKNLSDSQLERMKRIIEDMRD